MLVYKVHLFPCSCPFLRSLLTRGQLEKDMEAEGRPEGIARSKKQRVVAG